MKDSLNHDYDPVNLAAAAKALHGRLFDEIMLVASHNSNNTCCCPECQFVHGNQHLKGQHDRRCPNCLSAH
jgi:rubrerythrin